MNKIRCASIAMLFILSLSVCTGMPSPAPILPTPMGNPPQMPMPNVPPPIQNPPNMPPPQNMPAPSGVPMPPQEVMPTEAMQTTGQTTLRAGLRASDYGILPWPDSDWWVNSIFSMTSRFPGSTGAMVAVVVETGGEDGSGCQAHFPKPDNGTYTCLYFSTRDKFEEDFTAFDAAGIQVWLQVESSNCDVSMLIDVVMKAYGDHPCVIGFGVDAEWYYSDSFEDGKVISDVDAETWMTAVKNYNPNYKLFLKHWLTSHMPTSYWDEGLVFIDDSQDFSSMEAMIAEFTAWGSYFSQAKVGFQYGYNADQRWWNSLQDPPATIGNEILSRVPNASDLFWVDFTAHEIWP